MPVLPKTEVCPCGICGAPTTYTGTQRCDPCWNMQHGLERAAYLLAFGNEFARAKVRERLEAMLREAP